MIPTDNSPNTPADKASDSSATKAPVGLRFADLAIRADILAGLESLGFEQPTPIQEQVIPPLLKGHADLVGLAQTGTGKTAAFGIPLIQACEIDQRSVQALVLCPTRELCMQVVRDLQAIARHVKGLKVVAVYGGASMGDQIQGLRRGAQIVVATPGRLKDLLERGALKLDAIRTLVLDEADEMLSMGFRDDLDAILTQTPASKSTLLFSATMSPEISGIARRFMKKPIEITVGRSNGAADNVLHHYHMVYPENRYPALRRVVDSHTNIFGIVFCRTRQDTQDVASNLIRDGYNAEALHGDLSQVQRDIVMNRFRRGQTQMLVATDVAARGLDVQDLTHVINYNLPDDISVYTHRAGRTGRAGRSGTSISIVVPRERHRIRDLERRLKTRFECKSVPSGSDVCKNRLLNFVDGVSEVEVPRADLEPHAEAIRKKLAGLDRDALIEHFVAFGLSDFLKSYRNAPDLNAKDDNSRNRSDGGGRGRRPSPKWFPKKSGKKPHPMRAPAGRPKRKAVAPN